ncbi:MAG: ice-binding family protein [Bacteroidota bacterium]
MKQILTRTFALCRLLPALLIIILCCMHAQAQTLGKAGKYAVLAGANILADSNTRFEENIIHRVTTIGKYASAGSVTGISIPGNKVTDEDSLSLAFTAVGTFRTWVSTQTAHVVYYPSISVHEISFLTLVPGLNTFADPPGGGEIEKSAPPSFVPTNLSDTLKFGGSATDVYIIKITGDFKVFKNAFIKLGNVKPENIYWVVSRDVTITDSAVFSGNVVATRNIHGGKLRAGQVSLLADYNINFNPNHFGREIYFSKDSMSAYRTMSHALPQWGHLKRYALLAADSIKSVDTLDFYGRTAAYACSGKLYPHDSVTDYSEAIAVNAQAQFDRLAPYDAALPDDYNPALTDSTVLNNQTINPGYTYLGKNVVLGGNLTFSGSNSSTYVIEVGNLLQAKENLHLIREPDNYNQIEWRIRGKAIIRGTISGVITCSDVIETGFNSGNVALYAASKIKTFGLMRAVSPKIMSVEGVLPNVPTADSLPAVCQNLAVNGEFDMGGGCYPTNLWSKVSENMICRARPITAHLPDNGIMPYCLTNRAWDISETRWSGRGYRNRGKFMAINGADTSLAGDVWYQDSIPLVHNKKYVFSSRVMNLLQDSGVGRPGFALYINDTLLIANNQIKGGPKAKNAGDTNAHGAWYELGRVWNSRGNDYANIKIRMENVRNRIGCDGALDHIKFGIRKDTDSLVKVCTARAMCAPDADEPAWSQPQYLDSLDRNGRKIKWLGSHVLLDTSDSTYRFIPPSHSGTYTVYTEFDTLQNCHDPVAVNIRMNNSCQAPPEDAILLHRYYPRNYDPAANTGGYFIPVQVTTDDGVYHYDDNPNMFSNFVFTNYYGSDSLDERWFLNGTHSYFQIPKESWGTADTIYLVPGKYYLRANEPLRLGAARMSSGCSPTSICYNTPKNYKFMAGVEMYFQSRNDICAEGAFDSTGLAGIILEQGYSLTIDPMCKFTSATSDGYWGGIVIEDNGYPSTDTKIRLMGDSTPDGGYSGAPWNITFENSAFGIGGMGDPQGYVSARYTDFTGCKRGINTYGGPPFILPSNFYPNHVYKCTFDGSYWFPGREQTRSDYFLGVTGGTYRVNRVECLASTEAITVHAANLNISNSSISGTAGIKYNGFPAGSYSLLLLNNSITGTPGVDFNGIGSIVSKNNIYTTLSPSSALYITDTSSLLSVNDSIGTIITMGHYLPTATGINMYMGSNAFIDGLHANVNGTAVRLGCHTATIVNSVLTANKTCLDLTKIIPYAALPQWTANVKNNVFNISAESETYPNFLEGKGIDVFNYNIVSPVEKLKLNLNCNFFNKIGSTPSGKTAKWYGVYIAGLGTGLEEIGGDGGAGHEKPGGNVWPVNSSIDRSSYTGSDIEADWSSPSSDWYSFYSPSLGHEVDYNKYKNEFVGNVSPSTSSGDYFDIRTSTHTCGTLYNIMQACSTYANVVGYTSFGTCVSNFSSVQRSVSGATFDTICTIIQDPHPYFPTRMAAPSDILAENITGLEKSKYSLGECVPNPAINETTIAYKLHKENIEVVAEVSEIASGRKLFEVKTLNGTGYIILQTSTLMPGFYNVKLRVDGIETANRKLVIIK